MEDIDGKWVSSAYKDNFSANIGYDTREEAIALAVDDLGVEVGDTFFTGQASALLLPSIDPASIIEQFQCEIEDGGAEDGAEALDVSKEGEIDLGVMLNKAVEAWAEKHTIKVNAYSVGDVESHIVGAPDGEERPDGEIPW